MPNNSVEYKTIQQRVAEAFDKPDTAKIEKFLDITLSSWKQISDAITRSAAIIFLLIGAFEILIGSSDVKSLTLGPLTFSNSSLLQQFIPAVVAYLLYDMSSLIAQWRDHGAIYFAILKRFDSRLFKSELPSMVLPVIRGPWSIGPAYTAEQAEDWFTVIMRVALFLIAGILFPLAFEVQAYYVLIHKYGLGDFLVWVSAAASLFFIFAWLLRYLIGTATLVELRADQDQ
jgi:hypothetical protein